MADKDEKLICDALRRAAAEQAGLPLMQSRTQPGLFPASAAGKAASQAACNAGWLQSAHTGNEWTITEAGMAHLLELMNPRQVLEDCARAIESRQSQLDKIRAEVTRTHASLDGLRSLVERAVQSGPVDIHATVMQILTQCDRDCPLPDLYRLVQQPKSKASIGELHDALRRLRHADQVELHPWTGPLHAMPEPEFALLCGHEIAYYASVRKDTALGDRRSWDVGQGEVIASRVPSMDTRPPISERR